MLFGVSDPPRLGQRLRALSTQYKGGKDRQPSLISLAPALIFASSIPVAASLPHPLDLIDT